MTSGAAAREDGAGELLGDAGGSMVTDGAGTWEYRDAIHGGGARLVVVPP